MRKRLPGGRTRYCAIAGQRLTRWPFPFNGAGQELPARRLTRGQRISRARVLPRRPRSSTGGRCGLKLSYVCRRIVRMSSGDASTALAQLCAGVDGLLAAPVEGLSPAELASLLERVEVQRRRF